MYCRAFLCQQFVSFKIGAEGKLKNRRKMETKTLTHSLLGCSQSSISVPRRPLFTRFKHRSEEQITVWSLRLPTAKNHFRRCRTSCISPSEELISNGESTDSVFVSKFEEEEEEVEVQGEGVRQMEMKKREGLENQSIWNQMKEIIMFTGPATGLWICGPLMSLIDTAVIGQGSSIELAALGTETYHVFSFFWVFNLFCNCNLNMVAIVIYKLQLRLFGASFVYSFLLSFKKMGVFDH